jgi:hypothetical protein
VGAGDVECEVDTVAYPILHILSRHPSRGAGGRFGRDHVDLTLYPRELRKSACCGCRRCGRRRGDGQRTAGSRKTRVEGRVGASSRIQPAQTHLCILALLSSIISLGFGMGTGIPAVFGPRVMRVRVRCGICQPVAIPYP